MFCSLTGDTDLVFHTLSFPFDLGGRWSTGQVVNDKKKYEPQTESTNELGFTLLTNSFFAVLEHFISPKTDNRAKNERFVWMSLKQIVVESFNFYSIT